jgi:AraC-like DNA-binding protein
MHKKDIFPRGERLILRLADIPRVLSRPLRAGSLGYLPDNWHNDERRNKNIIFGITFSGEANKLNRIINRREYELRPPYFVFLEPDAVIQNVSEAHWSELYFSYDAILTPILRKLGFKLGEAREIRVTQRLWEMTEELLRIGRDIHAYGNADRADSLCESIMVEAMLAPPPGAEIGANESAARKIASFIELNFLEDFEIRELALTHGMSYKTFSRAWRQLYDYTPQERVTFLKIEAAKRMLLETSLRVEEIAYRLKFTSPLYFSRLFHRETGIPPTAWRRANQGR